MYGFVVSDSHRAYPTAEPKRPVTTAMEPVESTIDRDLLTEFTRTIPGQLFEARASRTKYEYDNETTRVEKVSRNALTEYGVEYTYRSDAHLIDHYQYMDSAGWLAKVTFAYESDLDLISQVENRVVDPPENDGVVSKYDYYYDDLGRLETVARSQGFYFGDGPTYHEDITYNDRNMLLTVRRFNSATPNSGTALPDYNQTFSYNTYGDRITEWYGDGDDDPNLAIAFNALDLPIYAREPGDPNDPNYAVKSFTYDDDQNMTEDDGMIYRYDAENRLIEVEPDLDPNCIDPESDYLSVYTYDYLSRVVRERRFEWDAIEEEWETGPALDHRFMYYKKMKLLTLGLVNGEIERLFKFAYGPGTDGRLGGPGSLLATRDVTAEKNFICFNNGAGKLVDLVDRADPNNVYENYEMTGNRGAFEGPCWSPDWLTDCDACGECFSGWWVDTRIPQPGNPGYSMDVTLPVCHCGDPSDNPGSQRRRKGPDDPCVVAGSPEGCGGCGGGSTLPGWIMVNCYSMPEDEEKGDGPASQSSAIEQMIGGPLPPLPPVTNCCPESICNNLCANHYTFGQTTCDPKTNKPCICICTNNIANLCTDPPCGPAPGIIQGCVRLHESIHAKAFTREKLCTGNPSPGGWGRMDSEECYAQTATILCVKRNANACLAASQPCACLQMLYQTILNANCRAQIPGNTCYKNEKQECKQARKIAKDSLKSMMRRVCH